MAKYFYETKYGSEEAAKVKKAGAKWNPDYRVWESDVPVDGVKEAKPDHRKIFRVHTTKTKQAYAIISWMMRLNIKDEPIPEDKYEQCLTYFTGDSYEDACCRYGIELCKELIDEGIQLKGFFMYTEEVLGAKE